ncbi:unnamed protein product [Caenorhabditis brenneri]
MNSQQNLTESVIRRVEEEARVLRALATENESNKTLIKDLQRQLKEAEKRGQKQYQAMEEMRKEIIMLRDGKESPYTINFYVEILTGAQFPFGMRTCDTIHALKLKIGKIIITRPDQQRLIFHGKPLEDRKSLADSGIVCGSTVYLVLRLGGARANGVRMKI